MDTVKTDTSISRLKSITDNEFSLKIREKVTFERKLNKNKKAVRKVRRKIEVKRNGRSGYEFNKALFAIKRKDSELLDGLYPERQKKWKALALRRKKDGDKIDLSNFSFIDNPNETLNKICVIAEFEAKKIATRINFLDERVQDIAPYVVWDLMRDDMCQYTTGGKMTPEVMKYLGNVDLQDFKYNKLPSEYKNVNIDPFKLMKHDFNKPLDTTSIAKDRNPKSEAAEDMANRINRWLSRLESPLEITETGIGKIKRIIDEILDNAERHCRDVEGKGNWAMAGCMQYIPENEECRQFLCHLTFISIGKSISESISETKTPKTVEIMDSYLNKHKKINENTIKTIFALQDGITSKPNNGNGGAGIMDMVQFTNEIGKSKEERSAPAIAIVSGNTYIGIKDRYHNCQTKTIPGEPVDEIWRTLFFNSENSFDLPPDAEYAYKLDKYFPGTIIAIRFYIDSSLLIDGIKDENDEQ